MILAGTQTNGVWIPTGVNPPLDAGLEGLAPIAPPEAEEKAPFLVGHYINRETVVKDKSDPPQEFAVFPFRDDCSHAGPEKKRPTPFSMGIGT